MFLGEYQHTLDPKGRVILPSVYRDHLTDGLVMTAGIDHCLTVHSAEAWEKVIEGLRALRSTDRRERKFARALTASAHAGEMDRQGRITVPSRLREYAGLVKDVAVVGADDHIELWDAERWDSYRDEALDELAETDQPFGHGTF